ncbi:MAG: DUF3800 domain-containing protein [Candidatus Anammoxibacter sp.]
MKHPERFYFVDEAGDLTLFNKNGKVLVGTEGCSRYFVLGVTQINNPHETRLAIEKLRKEILSDSYLKNIASVHKKTNISFHAKDDCPEVRMKVYKLIKNLDVKVYCIIRRKESILETVKKNNENDCSWLYNQNKIYDSCVKRLFKDRLHSSDVNHITFARRGKSDRNKILTEELNKAKSNFKKTYGKPVISITKVASNYPSNESCLQITDYCLWALQRLYERDQERYFDYLRDKFIRVIDLDDKRFNGYGVYYDRRNELTIEKIKDSLTG